MFQLPSQSNGSHQGVKEKRCKQCQECDDEVSDLVFEDKYPLSPFFAGLCLSCGPDFRHISLCHRVQWVNVQCLAELNFGGFEFVVLVKGLAFEGGDYDEFTDLIEGLLDQEKFAMLRSNFRFVLHNKSYDDAKEILQRFVVTPERLPSLLHILDREHEKMLENA